MFTVRYSGSMEKLPMPNFVPKRPVPKLLELFEEHQMRLEKMSPEDILLWATTTFQTKIAHATSCHFCDTILGNIFEKISTARTVLDRLEWLLLPETWPSLTLEEISGDTFDGTRASAALWERFYLELLCKQNEWKFQHYKVWVIGARRDQDERLAQLPVVSWNERFGVIRVAPLATWSKNRIEEHFRSLSNFYRNETRI